MYYVKKALNIILRAAEIILLLALLWCVYQTVTREDLADKLAGAILIALFVLMLLLCIGIEILKVGYRNKCPSCGKWFALKKTGKEYVGSEKVSVRVETRSNEYYRDGTKTGRYSVGEQYVPGTKDTYHINYVCKKCGKRCHYSTYKRYANL